MIDSLMEKFNLGSTESNSFRYCGKQFERTVDGTITQDTCDNTRRIKPIKIAPGRSASEPLGKDDATRLRSVMGLLAWVTRQTRPDLGYCVSRLQSSISGATVAVLHDANAVVQLAQQGIENKFIPRGTSNLGRGRYYYSNRCFIFQREELQITTRAFPFPWRHQ